MAVVVAKAWLVLAACALPSIAAAGEEGLTMGYLASWLPDRKDLSSLGDLYRACSRNAFNDSMVDCFGGQVGSLLGHAAGLPEVPLAAGVKLVSSNSVEEAAGPADAERGKPTVADMLLRRIGDFVRSHSRVSVNLSEARETYRRLKIKKMMLPFLVGVVLKVASFIPMVLGLMTLMGLKAFFTGNTALGIVLLLGLRKLFFSGPSTHHKEVVHIAPTHYEHYPAPPQPHYHAQHHPHQQQPPQYHHPQLYQSAEAELHSAPGGSSSELLSGYLGGLVRRKHEGSSPYQQSVILEPQDYKVATIPHTH